MIFSTFTVFIVLAYTWGVVPMLGVRRPLGALVIVLVLLVATVGQIRRRSRRRSQWGVEWRAFLPALGWALLITAPLILVAAFRVPWGRIVVRPEFWLTFLAMYLWGLGQQFALQTVLYEEAAERWSREWAVVVAAGLFAALHLPNPFLAPVTFVAAIVWCLIYSRYPNILALAFSHAAGSLAIIMLLDRSITGGMRVGYSYFLL